MLLISFSASFATCYFATPTIFGGRDQGAIATAAINLTKYKSFQFSTPFSKDLFQKYGPGKALNFPGFDYTKRGKLSSRFPKAYIIYLALLYSLFGLTGIQYANFIPLFLFFVFFWLTLCKFFDNKTSFFGFFIVVTFFPFLWFAKYTLTEIFMLFLIWMGIYFLITFRHPTSKELDARHLKISLFLFALSAIVRIEGIVFFFLALVYIHQLNKKKIITLLPNFKKYYLGLIFFLLCAYIYLNYSTLLDSFKNIAKTFLPASTKDSLPSPRLYFHLVRVFIAYNILIHLILGFLGIGRLVKNIRVNWAKSEFIPIFILFPSFFYLVYPAISPDDPWLLRRFVFAVFPLLIFYSIYFLNQRPRKKVLTYAIFSLIIASNLLITSRYLTYSENKNLLLQVEKISQKFNDRDLILVDRLVSGSGWSLISDPLFTLYQKQAVYFFNADDLNYLKKDKYKNIYLIAPLASKEAWYTDLIKKSSTELLETTFITNNFLLPSGKYIPALKTESKTAVGIWKIQ